MIERAETIEQIAVDALVPYARNSRTHSPEQVAQVAASIREFGFTNPVLVDGAGTIIAGHGRVMAAKSLSMESVPCIRLSGLTDAQKRAYVIADNKLGLNAGWDSHLLAEELRALEAEAFDLSLIGFSLPELSDLRDELEAAEMPASDQLDSVPSISAQTVSRRGDVWILGGGHRLMCGDSTSAADVDRLLAGARADLILTDPPYGVAYQGKTSAALTIENDAVDEEALAALMRGAFDQCERIGRAGAYWFLTVPSGPLHLVFANDLKRRGVLRQIMVWVKSGIVLGHSEYHYQHEPILFGWQPGGSRYHNPDRTRSSVWQYPKPARNGEHPTMKPVAMWSQAIKDLTLRGNLVFDPFDGSGTTIIAAEATGRRACAMELSTQYVDVAVRRWQEMTGRRAVRESDGAIFPEPAAA